MFRADLHCHSTCSDGSDSPEELIRLAAQKGLQGLSITDHDTYAAYQNVLPLAQSLQISLLTGVEVSSVFKGESIHILAYGFSLDSSEMQELMVEQQKRRHERNLAILAKLKKLGISLELEGQCIGRPHIATALMEKGIISSIKEGFDKYLGEGKLAYDSGQRIPVPEVLAVLKRAKAKAVLAHPQLIVRKRVLQALLDMPFDGLECYYAKMPLHREQPFIKIAEKKKWIITGGSDYHGLTKPQSELGSSWVGKEAFDQLSAI